MFSRSERFGLYWKRLEKVGTKLIPRIGFRSENADLYYIKSGQVLKKSLAFSVALLLVSSFGANSFGEEYYLSALAESSVQMDGIILSDSDGYLTKVSPQTTDSDRSQMTDKALHVVAAGETLSYIAAKYGVSEQTIVWENNMANKNSLRTGQTLTIPPVDGVTHSVKKGETLDKIAQTYGVDLELIKTQNRLDSIYLSPGQEIIVPGGEKIIPAAPKIIAQDTREGVSRAASPGRTAAPANLASTNAVPVAGSIFIFPTRGKITQYFHAGHYAYDIADASRPPIWAAAAGTVEKVSVGTWGGGYGNHLIVDHGNGYKTLYAHMTSVSVSQGQYVNQGEAIGQMGNTGRVYGVTGIHLHFEVRKDGVKVNPGNFF